MALVYGQEYATAQRAFLYALRSVESGPPEIPGDVQDQPAFKLQESRLVLKNFGFGETQIEQLRTTRRLMLEAVLTAPASGIVVARNIFPKQEFARGTELFRIVDLRHVWVLADLFGDDEDYVRKGASAHLSLPDRPEQKFQAVVSDALSRFDGTSHSLKLRLDVANPTLVLRPDMFVDVEFSIDLPEAITVPEDAVVESGRMNFVFIDRGEGTFEPRVVETAWRFGGRVQIVRGLNPGESIVVSGNFLLDSESRMRNVYADAHD
jgi:RND family efflux transporter MFP subunit